MIFEDSELANIFKEHLKNITICNLEYILPRYSSIRQESLLNAIEVFGDRPSMIKIKLQ